MRPKFFDKLPGSTEKLIGLGPSIYFLVNNGRIVYIGQSRNPISRLRDHNDYGDKEFDSAYFWQAPEGAPLIKLESALIALARPIYNGNNRRPRTSVLRNDQIKLLEEYCPQILADVQLESDPDEMSWGPVRIIAGPYEGMRGYYDDDDFEVARRCAYCRSSDKMDDRCTCVVKQRAIVYLGSFLEGDYVLLPHSWLEEISGDENPIEHDEVIYGLWPGLKEDFEKRANAVLAQQTENLVGQS
jgi:hypothetical protein